MSHELIAIVMFSGMMLMLMTGQRVFGAIGFVGALAGVLLWGTGGVGGTRGVGHAGWDAGSGRAEQGQERVFRTRP